MNIRTLYRYRHIIKQAFPILAVITACLLLSGFPGLLKLMLTNSMQGIDGNVKEVMCSGITFFLYLLGTMGGYFLIRTDFKHFNKLVIVGTVFIAISVLGTMILWNYAYT